MKRTIKKSFSLLLVFLLFMGATFPTGFDFGGMLTAFATETCSVFESAQYNDGVWAYEDYSGSIKDEETGKPIYGVCILDYHGTDTNVVVPEYIDGKPVVSVSKFIVNSDCCHYEDKKAIESVILPSTLREIGNSAFREMPLLKTISIPANVEYIRNSSFQDCFALETVIFNEGEGKGLITIGSYAFQDCTSLVSVKFPASLKKIYSGAFQRCTSLSDVTFNEGLTSIGGAVFRNCNLKSVELKEGLLEIGTSAFSGNQNLKTISLPESLEEIGDSFLRSTAVEEIDIPQNAKKLGKIINGSNIKSLVLPANLPEPLTGLGESTALETLVVENTDIGEYGFGRFPNLKTLIYKGTGTFDLNPFNTYFLEFEWRWWTEAVLGLPETAIFTDAINPVADNIFVNDYGYYFRVDSETGYYIYEKPYFKNDRYMSTGVNVTDGDFNYYVTINGDAVIAEYTGAGGTVTVPEYFENDGEQHTVIGIGRRAFKDSAVTSVILPSKLEMIGENAFYGAQITSVTVPDSVTNIGEYAFAKTKLTAVTVPGSVKMVNRYCFSECTELKDVTFANGVEYIEEGVFYNSPGPYNTISIPPSMLEISDCAFYGIDSIDHFIFDAVCYESDMIPYDDYELKINQERGRFAFLFDREVREMQINKFTVGTSVEYLPTSILVGANVGEVYLPDNLLEIGEYSLYDSHINGQLVIPDSVTKINKGAFSYIKVKELTLPENLGNIEENVFEEANIETLNFNCEDCVFDEKIETEIEGIWKSPFYSCIGLKTVNIGENVSVIPDSAFCGLTELETVNIPDNVTAIGKGAFAFSGVETLTGMTNVEKIGDYAFYKCENLETVNLGNEQTLFVASFADNKNPETVDYANKLMFIGANAFANCTSLAQINIPDSVNTIGEKAFYGDTALKNVEMSDNVIYVADECFNGCSELSSFIWNPESKLIGRLAFANCAALSEFDFVNVEKLYDNSFFNSGVAEVQLGEGENETASELKEIETRSFMDCDNLATLGVGGNVETIKTQAFANCENLEIAFIADSVTEIAADAFDGCGKLTIFCTEDSYAYSYAKEQGIPVSTLVIAPIPNQTYTGSKIEPEVSVSASGNNLEANIDFGVTYANNINVGNADVNVKGKGDFRLFSSKANFTIITKNISSVTVAPIADQPYTGEAIAPKLTVTDGVKYLAEGKDYTVTYYNNIEEGTATAKITGKGNYSGFSTISYVISEEAREQTLLEKFVSAIKDFFDRIISFFAWMLRITQ